MTLSIPTELPVMILPDTTLFPGMMLPLHIFEPRYRRMLADVLAGSRMFSVAMRKPGGTRERASAVGGVGLVRASVQGRDGTSNLILQGLVRVAYREMLSARPYRIARVEPLPADDPPTERETALAAHVKELARQRLLAGADLALPPGMPPELLPKLDELKRMAAESLRLFRLQLEELDVPDQIADVIAHYMVPDPVRRQGLLEEASVEARLLNLARLLRPAA